MEQKGGIRTRGRVEGAPWRSSEQHLEAQLSERLAALACAIRDHLQTALAIETESRPLTKRLKAFQTTLMRGLDERGSFADKKHAQTLVYGLPSARIINPTRPTTHTLAAHLQTNPFLRALMETALHGCGQHARASGSGSRGNRPESPTRWWSCWIKWTWWQSSEKNWWFIAKKIDRSTITYQLFMISK